MRKSEKKLKVIILSLLVIILVLFLKFIPAHSKEEILRFFAAIEKHPKAGVIFIAVTVISSIFCIPISWLKAAGGICFGLERGFIYSILSATISSAISFGIARILGRNVILKLYNKFFKEKIGNKMSALLSNKKKYSFSYVFLLRNIYFIPFSLTNYLLGVTNISFKQYMTASILGMIPGTFTYTYFFAEALHIKGNTITILYPLLIAGCYYLAIYFWRQKSMKKELT